MRLRTHMPLLPVYHPLAIGIAIPLVLFILLASFEPARSEPPVQQTVPIELKEIGQLQNAFDKDAGMTRLVLLLSPT